MASGIENSEVVDLVARDADGSHYSLVMVASEPWSDEGVLALQSKIKSYLSFIEEGQFLRTYPDAQGKRLSLQLDTVHPLPHAAKTFIDAATRQWLEPLGITIRIHELKG